MKRLLSSAELVAEFLEKEANRRTMLKGAAALVGTAVVGCSPDSRGGADPGTGQGPGPGPDHGPDPGPDPGPGSDGKADGPLGGEGEGEGEAEVAHAGEGEGEAPVEPEDTRTVVGVGWSDDDYLAALDAALEHTAGLGFIGQGDTVYFKVNSNNGDLYPHSTNATLIIELAKRCKDLGASRIIVGDRSFWGDWGTEQNMRRNGIATAAAEADAELVAFEDHTVDWVQFDEADVPNWVGGYRLPLPVVQADHIINLPCVKTHFIAGFTMALKNMLGLPHPDDRARRGNLRTHALPRLWNQIAQSNTQITPSLNILDGYRSLITGGPNVDSGNGATYADAGIVAASTDRVAVDVFGVALLHTLSPDFEEVTFTAPWDNPQIQAAIEHGLGAAGPEELRLAGDTAPYIERYRELLS